MKYLIFLVFILTTQFFNCSGMATFDMSLVVITTNTISKSPAYLVTEQQSYTTGGTLFTYPSGLFTSAPTMSVTVEDPSPSSSIVYTAEASNASATSATIMVYANSSGVMAEAPNGSVTVHVIAIGN